MTGDKKWLKEEFTATIQERCAAVIEARRLSSGRGSAANAIVGTVRFLTNDTPRDNWHSVAVCFDRNYDVDKGLISLFPVRVSSGNWDIVQKVPINEFSRNKIDKVGRGVEGRKIAGRQLDESDLTLL